MNRRQLMIAAPAAALFTGPACASDTPAMAAFRDWKRFRDYVDFRYYGGIADSEMDDLGDHLYELLVRVVMEPSRDFRDLCAKVVAYTHEGEDWGDDGGNLSKIIMREACEIMAA